MERIIKEKFWGVRTVVSKAAQLYGLPKVQKEGHLDPAYPFLEPQYAGWDVWKQQYADQTNSWSERILGKAKRSQSGKDEPTVSFGIAALFVSTDLNMAKEINPEP